MMKKIATLLVIMMMIVPTIKNTKAEGTGVTFQGEAEKFVLVNSEDGDLFSDFKDIYPGETKKQTITLSNKDYRELRFYMSAKVLDAFGNDIADNMVYDIDFLVNGQSVFAGMIGGQDEVGLKAMEDNFLIATLAQNEEATLDIILTADGDVMGNEYQNSIGLVQLNFSVEHDDQEAIPEKIINKVVKTVVNPIKKAIDTGDYTSYKLFVGLAIASVAGVGIFVISKKKGDDKDEK